MRSREESECDTFVGKVEKEEDEGARSAHEGVSAKLREWREREGPRSRGKQ
jgi:hypothetical protein